MVDDGKKPFDAWREAEWIVQQRLGPPKVDPVSAGAVGAFSTIVVIGFFAAFSRSEAAGWPLVICAVIGFAGPYFYFKSEADARSKMFWDEYRRLKPREDAENAARHGTD